MSYLDEGFAASFRGVPFLQQGHTTTIGRKTAIYRLPFESRGVAHLDLGRAPRKFSIEALLLETELVTLRQQRDALIAALETEGSGLLVHPIFGRVNVVIEDDISIVESTEMGGMVKISFTAWEARETATQTSRPDAKSASIAAARAVRVTAGTSFEKNFSLDVPDFVGASNLAVLDNIIDGLTDINAIVGSALAVPSHYANQIERIANQAADLINTPTLLYNTIDATIAQVIQAVNTVTGRNRRGIGNLQEVTLASSALGQNTDTPSDVDTDARNQERINRSNMLISLRASALSASSEAAANAAYSSAGEAREVMQTLVDALTDLSDNAIDGIEPDVEVFDALRDLVAGLTAHLADVAGSLAEVTTYTPPDTLPALVIAYNLYGDATRFEELLARNEQVVHPLMVPGKLPLEILTP